MMMDWNGVGLEGLKCDVEDVKCPVKSVLLKTTIIEWIVTFSVYPFFFHCRRINLFHFSCTSCTSI